MVGSHACAFNHRDPSPQVPARVRACVPHDAAAAFVRVCVCVCTYYSWPRRRRSPHSPGDTIQMEYICRAGTAAFYYGLWSSSRLGVGQQHGAHARTWVGYSVTLAIWTRPPLAHTHILQRCGHFTMCVCVNVVGSILCAQMVAVRTNCRRCRGEPACADLMTCVRGTAFAEHVGTYIHSKLLFEYFELASKRNVFIKMRAVC